MRDFSLYIIDKFGRFEFALSYIIYKGIVIQPTDEELVNQTIRALLRKPSLYHLWMISNNLGHSTSWKKQPSSGI
jgi:hypothetical protein